MKKQLLTLGAASLLVLSANAQTGRKAGVKTTPTATSSSMIRKCGTAEPSQQWEADFQQRISEFVLNQQTAKAQVSYTIPVVVHVIHSGQAVNTFPNISNAQINSQIQVFNDDFKGVGLYYQNCPTVFKPYLADLNIKFMMATVDKNGATMATPGIDRVNYTSIAGAANPTAATTTTAFQSNIDTKIKPGTIWDPTKYFNFWVTDENANVGLLGYATFPSGTTGLTGITGSGTATTDGVWCWAKAFGATGTLDPTYNLGRTMSHETGHWLGLRHIWGDGSCATDYCNDTPTAKTANYSGMVHPFNTGTGACAGQTTGEMFQNFMDYSNDNLMFMFTNDQKTRAQTAMSTGTHRKLLGTHGLAAAVNVPVADMTYPSTLCSGTPLNFGDASMGTPSTYSWNFGAGATPATSTAANPAAVTYSSTGTKTITLTVTNAFGTNTTKRVITVGTSCAPVAPAANFTFSPNTGICPNTTISFTDASLNTPTSWSWSFPGANTTTSTTQNPTGISWANAGTYTVSLSATNVTGTGTYTAAVTVGACTVAPTCNDTLTNFLVTDTIVSYTTGTGTGCTTNGYVAGNNCYGDVQKAEYYAPSTFAAITPSPATITDVIVLFYRDGANGTKGTTGTVKLNIYGGSGSTGPSGASLSTTTATLSQILATTAVPNYAAIGNPNIGYPTNVIIPYKFHLATPLTAPAAGFFASVQLPTATGDTAVVMTNTQDQVAANTAWEQFSDNTWHAFTESPGSWGVKQSIAILPIMKCTPTGIASNSLENAITLMPNPSNGMVNVVVTLPSAADLTVEVRNALGQLVTSARQTSVSNTVLSLDLTNENSGVYFVTINNGTEKTVKRVVLNK